LGSCTRFPGRALYAVNLALDELVSNVILYGYDDPSGQQIIVRLEIDGPELCAWLEDGGRPFDPGSVEAPNLSAPLEKRQIGGLGIHLVRSLMDKLEYRQEEAFVPGKRVEAETREVLAKIQIGAGLRCPLRVSIAPEATEIQRRRSFHDASTETFQA
jgi:serine/threonine-protein kinase RsbW